MNQKEKKKDTNKQTSRIKVYKKQTNKTNKWGKAKQKK